MDPCTKCGSELPENANFCPKCGKKVHGKTIKEEFEVKASELVDKVKAFIHEGNVRRIIVKDQDGKTLMEFPPNYRCHRHRFGANISSGRSDSYACDEIYSRS